MNNLEAAGEILATAKRATLRAQALLDTARNTEAKVQREYDRAHRAAEPSPLLEVTVPPGMVHIGWVCQHEPIAPGAFTFTPHRETTHTNKRGWTERHNIRSSINYRPEDPLSINPDAVCRYIKPIFIVEEKS